MSVGTVSNIYAGVPGLATLGLGVTSPATTPATTTPAPTTTSTPSTTPAPNPYAGVPGLATLGLGTTPATTTTPSTPAASTGSTVAGFSVLGIQGNGHSTTPAPSSSPNVYQTTYDGIVAASNNYLQQSLLSGQSNLPVYTGSTNANAFTGLSATLAAISTGLQNGFFQGTGFNALA